MKTKLFLCLAIFLISILSSIQLFAHCDSMDGPVIADAKKAISQNNINFVLKWVKPDYEKELIEAFNLVMIVRNLSPESKQLADKYYFETVVRLHRMGEGMPFTGIKPSGTPIDEKILAADKSIELGNLTPLTGLVPPEPIPSLPNTCFLAILPILLIVSPTRLACSFLPNNPSFNKKSKEMPKDFYVFTTNK